MAYERLFDEEKYSGIENDFTQDHCKFSTPLHEAIILDNIEMVKLLLQQGAEIEVKDQNSYTPLLLASYHNRIENMFGVPYPVLALEHLWLSGYGL